MIEHTAGGGDGNVVLFVDGGEVAESAEDAAFGEFAIFFLAAVRRAVMVRERPWVDWMEALATSAWVWRRLFQVCR